MKTMSSILSSIAGIWLTVIIATATTVVLFGILFIIILVARRKVRKEEEAKEGKEVNLAELQQILDNIKSKQQLEAEKKEETKDGE